MVGPISEMPVNKVVNADLSRPISGVGARKKHRYPPSLSQWHLRFLVPMVIPVYGTRLPSSAFSPLEGVVEVEERGEEEGPVESSTPHDHEGRGISGPAHKRKGTDRGWSLGPWIVKSSVFAAA